MEHICNECLLNKGCAFSLMTKGIIKCRDHIHTGLYKTTQQAEMERLATLPALTANDIKVG